MRARRGTSARYIKAINFVKKRFASPFSGPPDALCGEISIDVFCGWSENENSKPETRIPVSGGKEFKL